MKLQEALDIPYEVSEEIHFSLKQLNNLQTSQLRRQLAEDSLHSIKFEVLTQLMIWHKTNVVPVQFGTYIIFWNFINTMNPHLYEIKFYTRKIYTRDVKELVANLYNKVIQAAIEISQNGNDFMVPVATRLLRTE